MAISTYPTSSSANIVVGCGEIAYFENRKITGAALDTPDTMHAVSIFSKVSLQYKELGGGTEDITVTTPRGSKYTALQARLPISGSSSEPAIDTLTITFVESSAQHILFPALLKGEPILILIDLGVRDGYQDTLLFFGRATGTPQISYDNGNPVGYDIAFKVLNNTEGITAADPEDEEILADPSDLVIGANQGFSIISTEVD
jgi:hypothetical protein